MSAEDWKELCYENRRLKLALEECLKSQKQYQKIAENYGKTLHNVMGVFKVAPIFVTQNYPNVFGYDKNTLERCCLDEARSKIAKMIPYSETTVAFADSIEKTYCFLVTDVEEEKESFAGPWDENVRKVEEEE
jgi:hypothetical protein